MISVPTFIPTDAPLGVQNALKSIHAAIAQLASQDIDLNGRRIINAGRAIDGADYITKETLDQALKNLKLSGQSPPSGLIANVSVKVWDPHVIPGNQAVILVLDTPKISLTQFAIHTTNYSYPSTGRKLLPFAEAVKDPGTSDSDPVKLMIGIYNMDISSTPDLTGGASRIFILGS